MKPNPSRLIATATVLLILTILLPLSVSTAQPTTSLVVFAAASLTDAFEEIAINFEAANPGVEIAYNFGSSTTLATQVVEGAPADVFASANARQMQVVQDAGLIAGRPRTFVKNRLVLAIPFDNPANIQSLDDLATEGIKLVVAAPGVPVREYTETMLDRMSATPRYGEAFKQTVLDNVVSEEENVRQVVFKLTLGEADAGIVYLSDITPDVAAQVFTIPIPDAFNTIATYPLAALNTSAAPETAQAFIDYVVSDAGQEVLVKWGFISANIPPLSPEIALQTDGNLYVEGQVLNPLALSVDDLRAQYAPQTIEVTYLSGEETVQTSFTGVLLWEVINAAQVNTNADVRNDKLSLYIVATGADGYQSVISWGEIDPEYGNQPVLIALDENGQPLAPEDGGFRLIVPSDIRGGRYVRQLINLSIRDAPPSAQ
jgi:molybdate transport system substrate-binding protein